MPVTTDAPAPYAPASAVLEIISRYRAKGLPTPINGEVLSRAGISKSLIQRTLYALQSLDLVDDKGQPTNTLESLRLAPEAEYKQQLTSWLTAAYADILIYIDPQTADEVAIRDAFRSYTPVGQQARMVTLFIGLFAAAGIGPEKTSKPRHSRNKPGVSRANGSPAPSASNVNPPSVRRTDQQTGNKPPGIPPASDVTLEHKLFELMKDNNIGEEQLEAIWTLLRYLASKAKNTAADQK